MSRVPSQGWVAAEKAGITGGLPGLNADGAGGAPQHLVHATWLYLQPSPYLDPNYAPTHEQSKAPRGAEVNTTWRRARAAMSVLGDYRADASAARADEGSK